MNADKASTVSKLTLAHGSQSEESSMDTQESVCEFGAEGGSGERLPFH